MNAHLEILASGPLTTVQDLGRPGHAHYGVPPSGAADRSALRLANRLLGNAAGAAALEVTFGGLRLRADAPVEIAVTGAPADARVAGRGAPHATVLSVERGDELRLGVPVSGVRTYVGVRGGIDVAPVLGSRATDLLSGLGPDVVRAGARLPVGAAAGAPPAVDIGTPERQYDDSTPLRVLPGPRATWFSPGAHELLVGTTWTVGLDSNRVGLRLTGGTLERSVRRELPSEGVVRGAVQVPPSGEPMLLLADHPLTGGYPVIAVVVDADVDRAAQVRPGEAVRFRVST